MARWIPAATLVAVALLAAACGDDGGDDGDETPSVPTRPATAAATSEASITPSGDIRRIDLQAQAPVAAMLAETGGQYVQTDVIYADVTGDGIEEAVVPIASGGTAGAVGFLVLTPTGETVASLLEAQPEDAPGLAVAVEGEQVVQLEPVYGPDDPECCPSLLRRTIYGWNGAAMAIESVETIEGPGFKTPQP